VTSKERRAGKFLNSSIYSIIPRRDLGLQNGNQKRQPEAAIETAIEAAKGKKSGEQGNGEIKSG